MLSVSLNNALEADDPSYFSASIDAGGSSSTVNHGDTDTVYAYRAYLDTGDQVYRLSNYASQPQVVGQTAVSTATLNLSGGGQVAVEIESRIPAGTQQLITRYSFSASGGADLRNYRFFQYLDSDVPPSAGDDIFTVQGSIATGNLRATTIDPANYIQTALVQGQPLQNAQLTGFAADRYSDLSSSIEGGDFDPPATGMIDTNSLPQDNFEGIGVGYGPGDNGMAFAYEFSSATTATVRVALAASDIAINFPDLMVTRVQNDPVVAQGHSTTVRWTVVNNSQTDAQGPWTDAVYLSTDDAFDAGADHLAGTVVRYNGLEGDAAYQAELTFSADALSAGTYYVLVVTDAGEAVNEATLETNNTLAGESTLLTGLGSLTLGQARQDVVSEQSPTRYYALELDEAAENLLISLDGLDDQGVNELYLSYNVPPVRGATAWRSIDAGQADQQIVVGDAPAGTWYVMVHSSLPEGTGTYKITARSTGLEVTSVSPEESAEGEPVVVQIDGVGFEEGTTVTLRAANNRTYTPIETLFVSRGRISAVFEADELALGEYDVIVTNGSESVTTADALTIVPQASADFQVNITAPAYMGYHVVSTIVVEYRNNGDAPMRAPLLFVTVEQNGQQKPWLTLDSSIVTRGFWTSVKPDGFEHYGQVLASGETPGWLLPGESNRVEVYYAGWQRPWDMGYPPFEVIPAAIPADATAPMDWSVVEADMRPAGMPEDAWAAVLTNLKSSIGQTWGDYLDMLSRNAQHLAQIGQSTFDARKLLQLEFLQANAGNPIRSLGGAVDAISDVPAGQLGFVRTYGQTITSRYRLGALGRGWMHNWEMSLSEREDGIVDIQSPDRQRTFLPDSRGGYFAPAGEQSKLRKLLNDAGYELREPDGRVLHFSAAGVLTSIDDSSGNTVTLTYQSGRLTAITHEAGPQLSLAYNAQGRLAQLTDPVGRVTLFGYDASGEHLLSVTHPDQTVTTYTYDTTGPATSLHALTSVALPDGGANLYTYDTRGRLVEMRQQGADAGLTFAYGPSAAVTATDPAGQAVTILLDPLGQVASSIDAAGRSYQISFDGDLNITEGADPGQAESQIVYDDKGNIRTIIDPLGGETSFGYFFSGLLANYFDAVGRVTRYQRNDAGQINAITDNDGTMYLDYDSRGVLKELTNARSEDVTFTTNSLGQLTRRDMPDGTFVTYTYDSRDRLASMTDSTGTTTFTYTTADLLDRVTYPGGLFLDYDYDAAGRRIRQTDQTGHQVNYAYDDLQRLERLTDESAGLLAKYTYDDAGRVIRCDLGNDAYTVYGYDDADFVTAVLNYSAGQTLTSRFDYAYDNHGALVSMTTLQGEWTYRYDLLGRLLQAQFDSNASQAVPDQSLLYEYNAAGDRVRTVINNVETEYTPAGAGGYTEVGDVTFTFDRDGNLTTRSDSGVTTSYEYDALNRLTSVQRGGDTWTFVYDGLGQRVAETYNGVTTRYLIDPTGLGTVVGAFTNAGATLAQYDYGLGLISRDAPGNGAAFYQYDAMGNTASLTSAAGSVLAQYAYMPFGELLSGSGAADNPFTYGGASGVMTDETGLHFMRARYYDSELGRFVQKDPLGLSGGVNPYTYAENNPLVAADPTGLQSTYHKMIYMALLKKMPHAKAQLMAIMRVVPNTGTFEAFAAMNGVDIAALRQVYLTKFAPAGARMVGTAATTTATTAGATSAGASSAAATTTTATAGAGAGAGAGFLARPTLMGCAAAASWALLIWQGGSWAASGLGHLTGSDWLSDAGSAMDAALSPEGVRVAYEYYSDWLRNWWNGSPSQVVGSFDPNQKLGPAGAGEQHFVAADDLFSYRIDFENNPDATAPAQMVRITDPLDADLDYATFQFTQLGWGDVIIPVPAGLQHYQTTRSMTYEEQTFDVVVTLNFDPVYGEMTALFQSLDSLTGLPPDIIYGFLPPEDETGRGQGFVSYTIEPMSGKPTGTEIRNIATITFDFNDPITTNQVDPLDSSAGTDPTKEAPNVLDAGTPASAVHALPLFSTDTQFTVAWSGQDDAGGSGIASYDVYVSISGGPFEPWLTDTTDTQADYTGQFGETYAFYSLATDAVGHTEAAPTSADASVIVTDTPIYETTLSRDNRQTATTFMDADGSIVKVVYKGKTGSAAIQRAVADDQAGDITAIIVQDNDPRSTLTILAKGGADSGRTAIGQITIEGPMKKLQAPGVDLNGAGLSVGAGGFVENLNLHDLSGGADLTMPGTSPRGVKVSLGTLGAGSTLGSGSGLKKFVLAEAADGADVAAPWVSKLAADDFAADLTLSGADAPRGVALANASIRNAISAGTWTIDGDVRVLRCGNTTETFVLAIEGDLNSLKTGGDLAGTIDALSAASIRVGEDLRDARLTLHRNVDPANARTTAMKKLTVKQWIDRSEVRTNGHVGKVIAGGMRESLLFAGVDEAMDTLPAASASFEQQAMLSGLTLRGIRGEADPYTFVDSLVAADSLGTVNLGAAELENGGVSLGVAARLIRTLKATQPDRTCYTWPGRWMDDPVDLAVRVL